MFDAEIGITYLSNYLCIYLASNINQTTKHFGIACDLQFKSGSYTLLFYTVSYSFISK